jgi:leucyl-tRNA synthetase
MDTFVCSSWYYFRYADPQNTEAFAGAESIQTWCPVDLYVGGAEHTVLHLLYARFFAKVAHRAGLTDWDEPFQKLRHQGMILGENGEKMSKSKGNVVNPDEIVEQHGADTLRVYEMFMGPFEASCPWQTAGVTGVRRFLEKVWKLYTAKALTAEAGDAEWERTLHQTIKKVTEDIENFQFNTAVSQLMICVNAASSLPALPRGDAEKLLLLLSPYAPHLAEELWGQLGHTESLAREPWPTYDERKLAVSELTLAVTVNGKLRDTITVTAGIGETEALAAAKASAKVQPHLAGKELVKEIYVAGKLVNLVVN